MFSHKKSGSYSCKNFTVINTRYYKILVLLILQLSVELNSIFHCVNRVCFFYTEIIVFSHIINIEIGKKVAAVVA